jgi:TolB protein
VDLGLSPDGEQVVYTTLTNAQEDIAILNCDGSGEPQWLTDDEYKDRGPQWSPDGKRIAFYSYRSGNFEIWLINADGTGLRRLTEAGDDRALIPLWSPDGKRLSFTNVRGETWSIEVDKPWGEQTPQLLNPRREPPLRFWPSAWSSDSRRLVAGVISPGSPPFYAVYTFETGQFEKISDSGSASAAWLEDDRRVLFIFDGAIVITDTVTKKQRPFFTEAPDRIVGFKLSRDNRRLYYIRESVEADIWLLQNK